MEPKIHNYINNMQFMGTEQTIQAKKTALGNIIDKGKTGQSLSPEEAKILKSFQKITEGNLPEKSAKIDKLLENLHVFSTSSPSSSSKIAHVAEAITSDDMKKQSLISMLLSSGESDAARVQAMNIKNPKLREEALKKIDAYEAENAVEPSAASESEDEEPNLDEDYTDSRTQGRFAEFGDDEEHGRVLRTDE